MVTSKVVGASSHVGSTQRKNSVSKAKKSTDMNSAIKQANTSSTGKDRQGNR